MKIFYAFLLAALIPATSFSQSNYCEGYLLKNNGDTLKGYINIQEWSQTPKTITYKTSVKDKEVTRFTPLIIKSFYAGPSFTFISYTGLISNNKNVYPRVDYHLDTTSRQDTVFLKQLATGTNASLYKMTDEDKVRYFFKDKDEAPVELKYYNYYLDASGTMLKNTAIYVYPLLALTNKYATGKTFTVSEIEKVTFNEGELIKHFRVINNSSSVSRPKEISTRFFIGAGANYNYTWISGKSDFSLKTNNTVTPEINFGIDVFGNPVTQRLVFRGEVSFGYLNTKLAGLHTIPRGDVVKQTYQLDQYTIGVTPQVKYNLYNTKKLKYYLGGGIGLNSSFYPKNRIVNEDGSLYATSIYYRVHGFWMNFPFQTGIVLAGHYELSVAYTTPGTLNKGGNLFSINTSSVNFGFKYLFGK